MIRLMCGEDIEAVAKLEEACFEEPWSRSLLTEGLGSRWDTYFVLSEAEEVLGYAVLRILGEEGELQRIAVHPGARGRGYAKKLMEKIATFSREKGVTSIALEVRESNAAARNLYETYGFAEEGLRKAYYHHPTESAVLMRRCLI